jgi:hypothetical protein
MNNFKDKNGLIIECGMDVIVPEPNETDIYIFEFVGMVDDILDNGNVIVSDGDGDFFEIEAERLEIIES